MYFFELVCVVFVAFCVFEYDAAVTNAQRTNIQSKILQTSLECVGDFPIQLESIQALRNRKIPDDENTKCFINCIYKRLGIMNGDGKVSEKKAKKISREFFKEGDDTLTKVDELISKCIHVNDEELTGDAKDCERATLLTKCFMENAAEIGLDIKI